MCEEFWDVYYMMKVYTSGKSWDRWTFKDAEVFNVWIKYGK